MKTITTIKLAEMLNREHKNILRNIHRVMKSKSGLDIKEVEYEAANGRMFKMYEIDRKAAFMLAGDFRMDFSQRIDFNAALYDYFDKPEIDKELINLI